MATLAREVLVEAERTFKRAEVLAAAMEPHLRKKYGDSAIYAYTNERAVPPGDVLLAAARAAGISLDRKLGMDGKEGGLRQEVAELKAEMERMKGQMAKVDAQLSGRRGRQAERERWTQRPAANQGRRPPTTPPSGRSSGRGM
jgi:hypothetical protein